MNRQKQTDGFETTVAIAAADNYAKSPERIAKRHMPLVSELGERGVTAVMLNGAKDRTDEPGQFGRYFTLSEGRVSEHTTAIRVDAAYDLTGGVGKYVAGVETLNPVKLRNIARSKELQYNVLHAASAESVAKTEIVLAEATAIRDGIGRIDADRIVIKVDEDFDKKYPIISGTKTVVARQIEDFTSKVPPAEKVLIQQYIEETEAAFHSELSYFDQYEQGLAVAQNQYKRELRAHTFDGELVALHGRVGLNREGGSRADEWVFFQPDSVPSQAVSLAETAARALQNAAGAKDAYLAVDMTPDASRIVEVNGRNISTMRPNAERPGAQYVHEVTTAALADKLASMGKRKAALHV